METIKPAVRLQRFSPQVSAELRRIDAAAGRIDAAAIWPASAEALRFSAQVGTIHYSTLLEGNRLSILMAERAVRRSLDPKTKAEIELVNYVEALEFIDERFSADQLKISEDLILAVHRKLTKNLGDSSDHFKPHHEGTWRDGEAVVQDPISGAIVHTGCPQAEVRPRMLGLIEWVNEVEDRPIDWPVHAVAGILHHNLTEVHPFADGNGRTARLMTSVLLQRHNLIPGRMFNFDRHYGLNRDAYIEALRSCQGGRGNHEIWTRYFLGGMADEYERVLSEVDRLSHITSTRGGVRVQLKESQQRALSVLAIRGSTEFSRRDYETAGNIGTTTATSDLSHLADAGVVDRIGKGSASRYRFSSAAVQNPWASDGRGRPRAWSDERIEDELRVLVGTGTSFPPVEVFKKEKKVALYAAIKRHGGPREWSNRLQITPPKRGPSKS